ncbi:MAG: hypothetical protein ACK5W7_04290 [Gemmatimonadaceae bacterium]|jgi:hypothetical protein
MTHDELDRLDALAAAAVPNDPCDIRASHLAAGKEYARKAFYAVPALIKAVRARDAEIARLKEANDTAYQRGFNAGGVHALSRALKEGPA